MVSLHVYLSALKLVVCLVYGKQTMVDRLKSVVYLPNLQSGAEQTTKTLVCQDYEYTCIWSERI